jgi:translation initiation factor 1
MNASIVYSTDIGRVCPDCGKPSAACVCRQKKREEIRGDGNVRVSRETNGRNGRCVTLITGVPLSSDDLMALAKKLKQRCGTGGTVKEGVIEIQGDHRDTVLSELIKSGYKAKISGG